MEDDGKTYDINGAGWEPTEPLTAREKRKIGNALSFFAERIPNLNLTKFLKLLFLAQEESLKRSGTPFIDLDFELWKYGPVARPVYKAVVDSDLEEYAIRENEIFVVRKKAESGPFSPLHIEILQNLAKEYRDHYAFQLVDMLHDEGSLWNKTAREHGLLDRLLDKNDPLKSTKYLLDVSTVMPPDSSQLRLYKILRSD